MKLAVTGKGGVGKTTVSGLLARALSSRGLDVYAIDADPDANLAASMGCADAEKISPIVELKDLIAERTGVKPGSTGGMFRLNPLVDDIPEKYAVDIDGVKVLVVGAVKKGGAGCYCPENSILRALISHLLMDKGTALVLDMEAGVEHLSRGTVGSVDGLIVVVNPGRRSIETALRVKKMAEDIGLKRIGAIGNMIRSEADESFIREALQGIPVVSFIPYDDSVREAEMSGEGTGAVSERVLSAITDAVAYLENSFEDKSSDQE